MFMYVENPNNYREEEKLVEQVNVFSNVIASEVNIM